MAAHSNRSPSPLSSRPTNPNPRNSENHSATRRSFSGNNNPFAKPSALTNPRRFDPITPANSPADFARRRSVGKEGNPKDCEEKENNDDKDNILKNSKLQSPAKGSRNFMSPTISAASKFTPSPRKKVLVERNEPVRTSISLSDGKAMFFSNMSSNVPEEPKSEMGFNQNQKNESSVDLNVADSEKNEAVQEDHPISKPSKKVTFLEVPKESELVTESQSESVITDSDDSLKMESSSKNKATISPSIAPLDADPSLPPYDPKINYLSPRPQFLHYKPNPRIEILLNKEKELDPEEFECLEDRFIAEIMSGNLSDSEGTEESQTDDSQKEEMEMEVSASADMVVGFEETEDNLHVSEQNAIFDENFVQKNEKKTWAFSKLKCFSVVMVVLIACVSISVTRSPSLEEFAFKDLSLSELSNFYHQSRVVTASARENFDRLARRLNQLSVNSISFISNLANELGKGETTLGPLKYMNLSDLQKESSWNGEIFLNNKAKEELVENFEEDELEEDLDTEMEKFKEDEEFDYDESFDTQEEDVVLETEEEMSTDSVKSSELESEYSEDIQNQTEVVSSSTNTVLLDAISQDHQESEIEAAVEVVSSDDRLKTEKSHVDDINLDSSTLLNQQSPSNVNSLSEEGVQISEDKFLAHYYYSMGVSSFFAALLAVAAAFLYHYKRNPGSANVVEPNPLLGKQTMYQEKKAFSQNWQTEVDESSCPSEMSSFQKSASYSKKEMRDASEVQSIERKTRKYNSKRESLASSSSEFTGSPSYGSFTTFERIPIKHANGEEEIITPVRRSSRIRSHQVISP